MSEQVICNHAESTCGKCPHATAHEVIWYDYHEYTGGSSCVDDDYCYNVYAPVKCVPVKEN